MFLDSAMPMSIPELKHCFKLLWIYNTSDFLIELLFLNFHNYPLILPDKPRWHIKFSRIPRWNFIWNCIKHLYANSRKCDIFYNILPTQRLYFLISLTEVVCPLKLSYQQSLYLFLGNGNPLQYSCLENPMDRGAWWATVHGVAKSRTQLSDFTSLTTFLEKDLVAYIRILNAHTYSLIQKFHF